MRRNGVVVGAVALLAVMLHAPRAQATFPGANGQLAYQLGASIRIASPDGTGRSRNITGGFNRDPAWSADGTKLAFTHRGAGDDNIWVLDTTETPPDRIQRITGDAAQDMDPAWSPDGRRVVFTSLRSGNPDLFVRDIVARRTTRLTFDPAADQMPAWSSNNVIVFVSNRSGNNDLFAMAPVPGAPVTQITSDPLDDIDPSWSPDGTQIAFTAAAGGVGQINAIAADGTGMRAVAPGGASQRFPHWAPDGNALEYTTEGSGVTIADGGPTSPAVQPLAVVAPGGIDADWGPLPTPAQVATQPGQFITVRPVGDGVVQAVPGARPVSDAVASQLQTTATLPVGNTVASVDTTDNATAVVRAATDADAGAPSAILQSTDAQIRQPGDSSKLDVTLTSPPVGCAPAGIASLAPTSPPRARMKGFGRARGNHARTGTRGTTWVVAETCAGTVTFVIDGSVDVVDFNDGRTRTISAGRCYVAVVDRTVTAAEKSAACAQIEALYP